MPLSPMPDFDSRAARTAWLLSRATTLALYAVAVFVAATLAISAVVVLAHVAVWLLTAHPMLALPLALAALAVTIRRAS